jgi:hypothetical protein
MKKSLHALLTLLIIANITATAQFSYQITNYNSTNTPVFSGNNFKCIWIGKGNRIWAGTQYQGLYWFDTARKAWTKSSQLTNVFINHIQNDKDGGIWIAQSGTSGQVGGGSNTAGGVNYFPDSTDAGMQFFSTGNTLSSRNTRGIYLDTLNTPAEDTRRLWIPQATYITYSNTAAGGISKWQYISSGNFQKNYLGLQVFPNTNIVSAGTPSCYTACGDRDEVWVGAETNYTIATGSTTQILRYDALSGQLLGGWDQNGAFDNTRLFYNNQPRVYTDTSTKGILPAGFRTAAMYRDREGRRWVGLRNGGVVVKIGGVWKVVNMPTIFPSGTAVNFNAITSDEFGYIYIGTSNGLVVFDNGGDVTDTTFYKRITTADGLPSNNITGVVYDKSGGRMLLTSDAGVSFMKFNYKIKVDMIWDYSFPARLNQPIGVAADGISRIYLKIKKRSDTLPDIKEVFVSLKDYTGIDNNLRGKFKKALVIDRYSEEASTGTSNTVTISSADVRPGLPGEYWVWYVSPDDFSGDSTGEFSQLSRRYEKVTIIATYLDNKKDTQEYKIGIVRPPTLLVHGLASAPNAWDILSHLNNGQYVKFINSPLFVYKRALTMDPIGYFHKNGAQLLGADVSAYQHGDRENTLQGNIEAMRNDMRYAANQVDYVCHSMGGIMIRSAMGFYPKKFYAGAGDPFIFKTYKKGFTHKIITINTPHNGAPVADVLDQFIPLTPTILNHVLNFAYYHAPVFIGGFFKPVGNSGGNYWSGFEATDAVNNLQVTAQRGGVNMLKTTNKFHMITGDLNWDNTYIEPNGIGAINYGMAKVYKTLMQVIYSASYSSEEMDQATAEATRAYLRQVMAEPYETAIADFLNWMAAKRGYPNYLADGDLIVPLMSQTARITVPKPYISVFTPTDMGLGTQGFNAWHSGILGRNDVGQRVFQLLNSKTTSDLFGDEIPADTDPEPPLLLRPAPGNAGRPAAPSAISISYDTTRIKIDAPLMNAGINTDSTITVKFRLKDTLRLAYVTINFQGEDSFKMKKIFTQQSVTFKVDRSNLGESKLFAYAVYDNATHTGVDFHIDSVVLNATSVAPLQGFRINQDVANITAGNPYFPFYEVQYNNEWIPLANDATGIGITIDSLNVLEYDAALKSFNGIKEGVAIANFTYNGFADSVLIKVILPYNANCINKTIAGGSFKNPVIWSKGTVPDICDSVVINNGHTVTLDTSITVRSLRINNGGTFTINNAAYTLQLGQYDEGINMLDNYGTLNISNGGLYINGRIKHNVSSTFNMSNGILTLDANKGTKELSLPDAVALFEAVPGMTSFNFSGGTLQVNDPPFGAISQTINCPYDFGNNSTLILGLSTSVNTSSNTDGFGGLSFPNKIGKLIINAGTRNGNRQFVNKKTLNVKTNVEVKTGSGIIIQAPLNVTQ